MKCVCILPLLLSVVISHPAGAEVPIRKRAVDLIILKDGTRLLGAIINDDRRDGTEILVRQLWLSENAAAVDTLLNDEEIVIDDVSSRVAKLVKDYIKQIEGTPQASLERIGFLEERLANLEAGRDFQPDTAELTLIRIPPRQIKQRLRQSNAPKQLAQVALLNHVENVETRERTMVLKDLRSIPASQLVTELPVQSNDTNEGTLQRLADQQFLKLLVATDRAFGQTTKLVLVNKEYISERGGAAQIQMLTSRLMIGQVQSQLQSLLNEGSGLPKPQISTGFSAVPGVLPESGRRIAVSENANVVEVSEMELDPSLGSAAVRISVYHRSQPGANFSLATSVIGRATAADITDEQKKRIAQDARVQQVTMMFSTIGSSGNQVSRAISTGAAVEVAQERARSKFSEALASGPAISSGGGVRIRRAELPLAP